MAKKQTKVPAPAEVAPAQKVMDGGPDDYDAESAYRSLSTAADHLANPDMMKRVKAHAGRKHKAAQGLNKMLGLDAEDQKDGGVDEASEGGGVKSIADLKKVALKKAKTGSRSM
jgi:hypothetical protein